MSDDLLDERRYDAIRLGQWRSGEARAPGLSRRDVLRLGTAVGLAAAGLPASAAAAAGPATGIGTTAGSATTIGRTAGATATADAEAVAGATATAGAETTAGPILKPLPPELFTVFGTNAEMRWSAMRGHEYVVPIDRFFVRNHTVTPVLDPATWSLKLHGAGLRGPAEFGLADLERMPAETITAAIECAGNGRSYYTTQQGQQVSGTAWGLGAVGVARWRGVRLATLLRRAGLNRHAVDLMPAGLDPDYVTGGVNLGPVRRPLPIAKALADVLVAYRMNGEPLPADHGGPVRLVVPSWIGISSIKWLGSIEVADVPLFSPWNTQFYRLFGDGRPAEGTPFDRQVVKSAFELDPGAVLPARAQRLTGRSWSANGPIRRVQVSVDGGAHWRTARLAGPAEPLGWQRWELDWHPGPGSYELLARATDRTGATQPDVARYNSLGYLFDAVVRVPVTVG